MFLYKKIERVKRHTVDLSLFIKEYEKFVAALNFSVQTNKDCFSFRMDIQGLVIDFVKKLKQAGYVSKYTVLNEELVVHHHKLSDRGVFRCKKFRLVRSSNFFSAAQLYIFFRNNTPDSILIRTTNNKVLWLEEAKQRNVGGFLFCVIER